MALTKVSGSIIKDSVSLSGNVSVGGTLTYQDVTNVDAVGIVTARSGLKVLAGGANIVGVVTATQFKGDGSQLTGISAGVSLSNGADNRVITASSASAIQGEANLTFDGSDLSLTGTFDCSGESTFRDRIQLVDSAPEILLTKPSGGLDARILNDGSGNLIFGNGENSDTPQERLRITSNGALGTNSIVRSAYGGLDLCSQGATNYGTLTLGAGGGQNGQSRNSNQENQFRIMSPTYANPSNMFTVMYGASGSSVHEINYGGGTGWAYAANLHRFFTTANQTTGTGTERLRITSGGLVGINENNPDRVLHVTKNGTACAKFGGAGGGSDFAIEIGQLSTSSSPGFNATGGSAMLFRNNGVESMRLIAGGAVVGFQTTTAADAKCVNVYTTGSNDGKYAMQIENGYGSAGGGNILKMKCGRGDGTIDVDLVRLDLYNNTRIFSIDNSGLMRFRSGCGSGSQDALAVYGVRAWINFNSTSGNAIRGKGGLSGITDRGVGQYTFNFSTNMPDGNYTVTCNSGNQSSGTSNRNRMSAYSLTTSNFRIDDYDSGAGNTPGHADRQMIHVMVVR